MVLLFSFKSRCPVILSSLTAQVKTSAAMWFLAFEEKQPRFHHQVFSSSQFSVYSPIKLWKFPFISLYLLWITNRRWFCKCSSASTEMIIWVFISVVNYNDLFANVETSLNLKDNISPAYDLFSFLYYWIQPINMLLRTFESKFMEDTNLSVIFFSGTIFCFWYQEDASFIKCF